MRYRGVEIVSAATLAGWGASLILFPTINDTSAFQPLLSGGYSRGELGFFMLAVGLCWLGGIFINGRWYRSPVLRTIGAATGFTVWFTISVYLMIHAAKTGYIPLPTINALVLVVADAMSMRRNARQIVWSFENKQAEDRLKEMAAEHGS